MALLGLALFGCFTLLKPYLGAIILAIIFAMIFHPIHAWIEKHLKNRKNLAASISCLILMTVFLLPLLLKGSNTAGNPFCRSNNGMAGTGRAGNHHAETVYGIFYRACKKSHQ